jgi:hypothetical protein
MPGLFVEMEVSLIAQAGVMTRSVGDPSDLYLLNSWN